MSNPESTSVSPNPYAPATVAAPFDRWRWLLAGVIGILGGYLTVSVVTSPFTFAFVQLDRYEPEQMLLFVSQAVFALSATSFAFLVAPGPFGRRVLAVVIFIVVTIVLVVVLVGRLSGAIRVPGPTLGVIINPYSVVLAAGGLAWLIAVGARPIAYFSVLLTLIVMPLNYVFALNGLASGINTTVQLVLSLAVAIVILLVSRPAVPEDASAPASQAVPSAVGAPVDRWRWRLAGVIGILGGYLTVSWVTGGIVDAIGNPRGYGPEFLAQFVVQGVFALAVTAFAFFVAPGPLGRRVPAIVLFVVIAVALVAFLVARNWGHVSLPGRYLIMFYNPIWIVLLAGGLGWLLAARARPLAYLTLLLTFIVVALGFAFLMNGVGYGLSTFIQYVAALAIAGVILLVSRPAAPGPATPVGAVANGSPSAAELAPTAFVAMEEGAEADAAPRPPAP